VQLTRQRFDLAVLGTWLTALLVTAFISLKATIPVFVVGAFVVGLLFAIWDGSGDA
jgi:hypothetical protein